MAKFADGAEDTPRAPAPAPSEALAEPLSLRERGARTVRALADVGNRLFPLKQRQERGEPLTEDERDLLAALEEEYRELELELRSLMRPLTSIVWASSAFAAQRKLNQSSVSMIATTQGLTRTMAAN